MLETGDFITLSLIGCIIIAVILITGTYCIQSIIKTYFEEKRLK